MSEWISVKDEMPKEGVKVLAYCACSLGKNPLLDDWFMKVDYISKYSKDWEIGAYYGYEITHWLPLPEPPEVEE